MHVAEPLTAQKLSEITRVATVKECIPLEIRGQILMWSQETPLCGAVRSFRGFMALLYHVVGPHFKRMRSPANAVEQVMNSRRGRKMQLARR